MKFINISKVMMVRCRYVGVKFWMERVDFRSWLLNLVVLIVFFICCSMCSVAVFNYSFFQVYIKP